MTLKTRRMKKILDPIESQMTKLALLARDDRVDASDVNEAQSVVFEQLNGLAQKFSDLSLEDANDYREMKSKIAGIIDEFCIMNNINKMMKSIENQDSEDIIAKVLKRLSKSLETLEELECAPLKQQLQDSWNYVKEMGAVEAIEDFRNIKELGIVVVEIFGPLQHYRKNLLSPLLGEKMALYTCQLCVAFEMLVEVIFEQYQLHTPIYCAKKYVCDRICWCFRMIIEVLDAPNPTPEDENFDKENHFVHRMDLALDIITSMPGKSNVEQIKICDDLWSAIEDVFSHAMAIAQVCQPYNFKAITGASQSIMSEYENLKTQLRAEKSDPTLNNLFMNTLNDALYRLERKINVSVLNLVMEVFGDPFTALRKLVNACGNSLNARERSRTDLTNAVEDFDLVIDKAMQIGMFAIACCNDVDRVTKIKHCMASLESLESELVPAAVAFYLHPDNREMRAFLKLLTVKWQSEINKLHNVVDLIIDSSAYCQVILDDLQDRTTLMSNRLDNREGITRGHVQGVVQRAIALATQVTATMNDIGHEKIDRQTLMMIRELKTAIFEAESASKTLLVNNATDSQQLRVIKRCELVVNVVKRLQPALVMVMNNSTSATANYGKPGMGQGDSLHDASLNASSSTYGVSRDKKSLTYIRTPYTVKNYKPPLSIQPADSAPRTPTDLSSLIPYIERGRAMRTDRSIMYKTPRNTETTNTSEIARELRMKNISCVRQHLFSRDSFVSQKDIDLSSQSLDLTAILDGLTRLSDTFSSTVTIFRPTKTNANESSIEESNENISVGSSVCLTSFVDSMSMENSAECSATGGGDAPSTVATPDRVDDIQRLERKIEVLQKQKAAD